MAVDVYTVPSTYPGAYSERPINPYRRIVGVTLEDCVAWSKTDPSRPETGYSQADAAIETVDLKPAYEKRLLSFFDRYIAETRRLPVPEPVFDPREPDKHIDEYNCHRFAYWMRGAVVAERLELPEAPDHIPFEGVELRRRLRMGEHGVIGRTDGRMAGAAYHSVVGLGGETDECLHVSGTQGNLGITTAASTLGDYVTQEHDIRLFVRGF